LVMVVEAWLARAAAARPRHTALQTPEGSWSYAELLAAARAGAAELAQLGAGSRERGAVALPPGLAVAQAPPPGLPPRPAAGALGGGGGGGRATRASPPASGGTLGGGGASGSKGRCARGGPPVRGRHRRRRRTGWGPGRRRVSSWSTATRWKPRRW